MNLETVRVQVLDDTTAQAGIPGVIVRFFDATNTNIITQATTDAAGGVDVTLVAPGDYYVRFYNDKVVIKQPQLLQVLQAPPDGNYFLASGHVYAPPEALNARMCCCSGFFRRPDNAPAVNHDIHFIPKFDPLLLEGNAMLTERVCARTDSRGYVQVELVRFGQYEVTVEGLEDQQRVITIPDAPSVNLPDLLFSVVDRIEFDPPGPWNIGIGVLNDFVITPTVYTSDGRVLPGTAMQDVQWAVSDPSVAAVLPADKTIVLRGMAPGSTTLVPTRWDNSIVRIPNPPIQDTPVAINVS